MSIDPKTSQQFYVTTGSGDDKIDSNKKTDLETLFTADKSKGNNHVIHDPTLGQLVLNIQRMQDDEDNTRTFVQDEDEMVNVSKGTFPTGCFYRANISRWIIPWTRTEWIGGFTSQPKSGGSYWGYEKSAIGAADKVTNLMWVEKVIPIGFQVYRVYAFGSNVGGSGNESQFRSYASAVISNANVGAGASSNAKVNVNSGQTMDSAVITSGVLNGDGLNTIRVEAEYGHKADVFYGGIIELTQI